MKTVDLRRYSPPAPVPTPVCAGCKAFTPDVLLPDGPGHAGAIALCWVCAHHVVEHGISVGAAQTGTCSCKPGEIFPRLANGTVIGPVP